MANEEHLARLKQGVTVWNAWRDRNPAIKPDLSGADLTGYLLHRANLFWAHLSETILRNVGLSGADLTLAYLDQATLEGADLSGATFHKASLFQADLTNANLAGANLTEANLSGTTLAGADLTEAILIETNLTSVDLRYTTLTEATFHEATMGWTVLGNIDLRTVRELETVVHEGPSTIGIDTLYRSHGNIPEVFLRGAGVPDEIITYAKLLVGRPFEFYSCFISYSSTDQEFAERLHADLKNKGIRCWFAPHDVQGGRKLHEQIDEGIRVHERLLLILSPYSMNSEWVKTEIAKARQREVREHRQVLFPIRLVSFEDVRAWECFDADTGKDSAREIREYFIPDFSNWKNYDAYQKAFQRLLRDLKPNITLL